MEKKYTIKDIAALAGVSKGTVDRVLHRRGKVSEKAQASVEKVLKEIDYQPNPIARNLKNNKVYNISVLIPDPKKDSYWRPAMQGIKEAAKEFKPFGILVKKYYYNPIDKASFVETAKEALKKTPDVLLTAALFQNEALKIFAECQEKNILVALFNNYINTFTSEKFIGQDLYQTGRVAASLIDKMVKPNAAIAILHLDMEMHMQLKENGFKAYFEEKNASQKIVTYSLQTTDQTDLKQTTARLFKNHKDIEAVFVTNSKAYLFIKAINNLDKNITVVGYDLLEQNIAHLHEGHIDFLIHQKPKRQAYLGIGCVAEHLLFGKEIPDQNLLPIDIITTENVQYYLD